MIELHPTLPSRYNEMPEGLDGYWWESEDTVCVPVVSAAEPKAFVSFLREIESRGKTVFFPTILNERLYKLLMLRGYQPAYVEDNLMGIVDGLALIR